MRRSAGIVPYRSVGPDAVEVFAGHMGGPFWARKDDRAWSIVKGEYTDEDPLDAARREFAEETGMGVPPGELVPLGEVRQAGKMITAWAVAADLDPSDAVSGTFSLEWPPRSGRLQEFPELDRFAWFSVEVARDKLVRGQVAFLDRLVAHLRGASAIPPT
jgi:predicted NUDIX family NTP pyrophosphohydrolase